MILTKILFLILLSSCGTLTSTQDDVPKEEVVHLFVDQVMYNGFPVEKEFLGYIRIFEIYYKNKANIEMTFANIPGTVIGSCYHSTMPSLYPSNIIIDRDYWLGASEVEKEMTILHELGHCVLGRAHVDDKKAFIPTSLMYKRSFSNMFYEINRAEYIKELFDLKEKPMLKKIL